MTDDTTTKQSGDAAGSWNITEVIEQRAARHPAALALILPDRVLSYRELITAVHIVALKLLANGVQARQTVGVSMGQTSLHLVTLLAIARIGAIALPLHSVLPLERRILAAQRFDISAVVSGREEMKLDGWPFIALSAVDLGRHVPLLPATRTSPDDPCWISLSSGTTGDPKGVLRTHGYLLDRIAKSPYVRGPQSRMLPMDLNFGVGFGQSIRMLILGGTLVLSPDRLPANLAYMVRSHGVTHWLLSPAMAEEILPLLKENDIHFPSLTYLQIVGGMPNPRLLDALFRKFTPNVYVDYGTSELGPVAHATPDVLKRAPTSVGRVLPWVQLEVVDNEDRLVPAGQSGSLRLKLEHMFESYHLDPTLTSERFRGGWYYPRDRARLDTEGLLYIEGREDDVFNVGGSKIYFRDVDSVLETHPVVREAATFVLQQPAGRDLLAVAVITARPMPRDELLEWARGKLGPISPEKLFFVDGFARTETGKVLREKLPDLFRGKSI